MIAQIQRIDRGGFSQYSGYRMPVAATAEQAMQYNNRGAVFFPDGLVVTGGKLHDTDSNHYYWI